MKLNEAEMRMAYQIEATSQSAALNEIYMTWRYAPNRETKATAESLLACLLYTSRWPDLSEGDSEAWRPC